MQVILKSGYEEDHLISNVKIALGAIGCVLAEDSQQMVEVQLTVCCQLSVSCLTLRSSS